jgi:uncharacterized membrane protein (DUF106 family)
MLSALLLLLIAMLSVTVFGPGLPRMFGESGDMLGAAAIIAVSIVLTGLLACLAILVFVQARTIASVSEQAEQTTRQIDRAMADAEAIEKLSAKTATRTSA